jgi:hypothetical protein
MSTLGLEATIFAERVTLTENGCWLWTGCVSSSGYAITKFGGKVQTGHRLSYSLYNGEIPVGMVVRHLCNNKTCVNPEHLMIGTQKDNMNDGKWTKRGKGMVYKPRGLRLEEIMAWYPTVVSKENGCWFYPGVKSGKYATVVHAGKKYPLHRLIVAYEEGIPYTAMNGLVRHLCNNKNCVNPEHLLLGNRSENARDRVLKHPMTKLDWAKVNEIRNAYECWLGSGNKFDQHWAPFFNVSEATIKNIRRQESWVR